eukprot:1155635-Pelagomonas_calceolata.AAC.15
MAQSYGGNCLGVPALHAAGAAAGSAANPEVLMSATTSMLDSGAFSPEGLQAFLLRVRELQIALHLCPKHPLTLFSGIKYARPARALQAYAKFADVTGQFSHGSFTSVCTQARQLACTLSGLGLWAADKLSIVQTLDPESYSTMHTALASMLAGMQNMFNVHRELHVSMLSPCIHTRLRKHVHVHVPRKLVMLAPRPWLLFHSMSSGRGLPASSSALAHNGSSSQSPDLRPTPVHDEASQQAAGCMLRQHVL